MFLSSGHRLSSSRTIRGPWYWALALLLTLFIWFLLSLAMDPRPDPDGSLASHPYGLTTALENQATDLLFQLRDLRHPESRQRGHEEPITIIGIDEGSLQSAGLRAQNWPRSNYGRLIHRASEGGASVIGLDLLLMGESGSSEDDKKQDITLVEAIKRAGNIVIAEKMTSAGTPGISSSESRRKRRHGGRFPRYCRQSLDADRFQAGNSRIIDSDGVVGWSGAARQEFLSFAASGCRF